MVSVFPGGQAAHQHAALKSCHLRPRRQAGEARTCMRSGSFAHLPCVPWFQLTAADVSHLALRPNLNKGGLHQVGHTMFLPYRDLQSFMRPFQHSAFCFLDHLTCSYNVPHQQLDPNWWYEKCFCSDGLLNKSTTSDMVMQTNDIIGCNKNAPAHL